MGSSRAFKSIRLVTHSLALLIILANIYLIGVFIWFQAFFKVEKTLNMGLVDMNVCYCWTILINVFLSLFGSCAINSKVKYFIKIYIICGFIGFSLTTGFSMFIFGLYGSIYRQQYGTNVSANTAFKALTLSLWQCLDFGTPSCQEVGEEKLKYLKTNYFLIEIFSFVLGFIIYCLGYAAMIMDINEGKTRIPGITSNEHLGYDSKSLRRRRFIDGDIDLKTTEIKHGTK